MCVTLLLCFVVHSVFQTMSHVHAAFTAAVNNGGDAAPATGSEEDRERTTMDEEDPVSRAAEKAADVAGKVRGVAEEVKEAGREVKDRAREVGEDVKESSAIYGARLGRSSAAIVVYAYSTIPL